MAVHLRFRQTFRFRLAEWTVALIMCIWGVLVLLNPDMFDASRTFEGMERIMPQHWWGTAALTVGLVGFGALLVNGAWRPSPIFRTMCCIFRALIWLQIVFGLALSGAPSTGFAPYGVFVVLEMINAYHATSDARTAYTHA